MYSTILVEDEFWTLEGIYRTFPWSEMGFEVTVKTTDPEEALDIILKENPDVVFTDIIMPEITGLEIIKKVRESGMDTVFVIISGYAEFGYAKEAVKLGAFDYCLKPVKDDDACKLLDRLFKYLNSKNRNGMSQSLSPLNNQNNNSIHSEEFKKMLEYINENYNKRLFLKELAQKFYINANYCCDLFKKNTGKTFSQYVISLKMKKAEELLLYSSYSISEVASMSGYSDYYFFNKVFKKEYGCTPSQFRKSKIKS